ncbi:uncharacterized protein BO87DRAFT_52844 [Aspergillus neoniger CBS 115656]|uniref:Uncharacterized protein n=1 Tax=Aspergillus neoniger (strain CBS 115656) TaxID=1448310 RepID=A0A318YJE5_ASPNB|nr:hypothetical protein BO87DRAFT_52844 [Aspergillus neoniger CBS 115656]PYH34651.1 hypothetical protein BO87DRAFT_52844 [Aspergillus neoniger CBS 115656]
MIMEESYSVPGCVTLCECCSEAEAEVEALNGLGYLALRISCRFVRRAVYIYCCCTCRALISIVYVCIYQFNLNLNAYHERVNHQKKKVEKSRCSAANLSGQ